MSFYELLYRLSKLNRCRAYAKNDPSSTRRFTDESFKELLKILTVVASTQPININGKNQRNVLVKISAIFQAHTSRVRKMIINDTPPP